MSDYQVLSAALCRAVILTLTTSSISFFLNSAQAADLPRRVPGSTLPGDMDTLVKNVQESQLKARESFHDVSRKIKEQKALQWYQTNCANAKPPAECGEIVHYFDSTHEKLMARQVAPTQGTLSEAEWKTIKGHKYNDNLKTPKIPVADNDNIKPAPGPGKPSTGSSGGNDGATNGGSIPVTGGGTTPPVNSGTKPKQATGGPNSPRQDIPSSNRTGNGDLTLGGNDNGNSQKMYNPNGTGLMKKYLELMAELGKPTGSDRRQKKDDAATDGNGKATDTTLILTKESPDSESAFASAIPSSGNAMAGACRSQSVQAARACQQALQNTQTLAGKVQLYNLNLQNQSQSGSGACGQMGEMAQQAAQQMAQEKANCNGLVAACNSACSTALAQLGNESNAATTEASAGQALCDSAEASITTMAMNVSQMQTAASQAQQCYSDITGQGIPKNAGAGQASGSISGRGALGEMSQVTGISVPVCPPGSETCGAEAPAGPGTNILLSDDQEGGGGNPSASRGGGFPELPSDSNKIDGQMNSASPLNPSPAPRQDSLYKSQVSTNTKSGFSPSRDREAERRARSNSNLPQLTGYHDVNGFHVTMAEPQKKERRPASSAMIGGKHTNIFTTVSQRYGRKANSLSP